MQHAWIQGSRVRFSGSCILHLFSCNQLASRLSLSHAFLWHDLGFNALGNYYDQDSDGLFMMRIKP